jgi:hypothetical protein
MRSYTFLLVSLLLLTSNVSLAAEPKEKDVMEILAGRWAVTMTEGDKTISGEYAARWNDAKTYMLITWTEEGELVAEGHLDWDPIKEEYVERWLGDGGYDSCFWKRVDGGPDIKGTGEAWMDGETLSVERSLHIISNDTWTVKETLCTSNGEVKRAQNSVFTRIKRQVADGPTAEQAEELLTMITGEWDVTFEEEGEKVTARCTATPTKGKHVLLLTWNEPGSEEANGILAWDAARRQVVETWFRNGEHVRVDFNHVNKKGGFVGTCVSSLGRKDSQSMRTLTMYSNGHYTHVITDLVTDGEPQPAETLTGRRVAN